MGRETREAGRTNEAPRIEEPWENRRGPAIAEIIAAGEMCDLYLLAGTPPERVPAARLLLVAASETFVQRLKLGGLPPGAEVRVPSDISAVAARAIVAYSCGVQWPFAACSAEEVRAAVSALGLRERRQATASDRVPTAALRRRVTDVPSRPQPWWRQALSIIAGLVLVVVSISPYLPTRNFNLEIGGFFMDDAMIKRNPVVVDPVMDWRRLWRTDFWGLDMFDPNSWTHKSFRPLVVLTFRWNYLLHGFNSCGFHVTNSMLHAIASMQLGLLGLSVFGLPVVWSALLAALFAAHPVHTESICYIVCRADILCAQVLFLAVQVYAPCAGAGSKWAWLRLPITLALIIAAGLCKETGFTFFGLLVIWEVLGATRGHGRHGQPSLAWRWLRVAIILVLGSIVCGVRFWYTQGTKIERMDPYSNPVSASEDSYVRKLSYALVHGMYMQLLAWPSFLCYDYSMDAVPLVTSLADVRLLLPCAGYLSMLQLALAAVRWLLSPRSPQWLRAEGPALGVTIFVLSFLPMANILFPVGTLVGERLLYIPSAGFLIAVVCVAHLELSTATSGTRHRLRRNLGRVATWVVFLGTLAAWWWLCSGRVLEWQSVERITLVDGLKQLRSSRTQFNLANLYLMEQRLDEALLAYRRAVAADPEERDSQPLYHAGQILMYRGQYAEAEQYLQKAVSGYFSPLTLHEEEVWHDYGLALWHTGKGAEAVRNLQNSVITNPAFPKGYNNLACALVLLGLSSHPPNQELVLQGLQAAEQAITLMPVSALYWRNAAALLALAGNLQASHGAWERLRQIDAGAAAGQIPQDCVWEFYFR